MRDDPIFVHAWFRSSSTWFWAKLRNDQRFCAYYEPLNEELQRITPVILRNGPAGAFKGDNHPELDRHYFYEYIDLIEARNLGFDPRLSYHRYFLNADEQDDLLRNYLERLIAAARAAGKRPALCFCRSQMRALWMRKHFGSLHVSQIRNPWDQWISFGRHPYFKNTSLLTAFWLNRNHPECFSHVPGFEQMSIAWAQGKNFRYRDIDCFSIFITLWIASTLQALSASDIVVDVDLIGIDREARRQVERNLAGAGLTMDLSDCRPPTLRQRLPNRIELLRALETSVKVIRNQKKWPLVPREIPDLSLKLAFLSDRSAEIIREVIRP
jgi:hypothetical protein